MRAHGAGFVIDVSASFETKRRALECYVSQFTAKQETEVGAGSDTTRLTRPTFLGSVEAKARRLGELVGVEFGEGLVQAGALLWREPLGGLFGARGLGGGPTA
jgi:hypothetical protein